MTVVSVQILARKADKKPRLDRHQGLFLKTPVGLSPGLWSLEINFAGLVTMSPKKVA